MTAEHRPDLLHGVTAIRTTGRDQQGKAVPLTAIPGIHEKCQHLNGPPEFRIPAPAGNRPTRRTTGTDDADPGSFVRNVEVGDPAAFTDRGLEGGVAAEEPSSTLIAERVHLRE